MPTVVTSAGLEVPAGYEHDGMPIDTSGEKEYQRRSLITETKRWGTHQGVIEGRWKLLHDPTARTYQLFDLEADPGELADVSAANDETLRRLKSALFEWDYDVRMKRSKFRVSHPKLSDKQLEKLRSLGYIR
jgi:arylsulfatase A-like enzyme